MKHDPAQAARAFSKASPPTRGRGLKPIMRKSLFHDGIVAPHAGAWIETMISSAATTVPPVAPHAGAWIETKS